MSTRQPRNVVSLSSPQVIRAALLKGRRADTLGASHDYEMGYRAANGRIFEVREFEDREFFLSEFKPNGRVCIKLPNGTDYFHEEPRLKNLMNDPNGLEAAIRSLGIQGDLVRGSGGLGRGSRYYPDLEQVALAISEALRTNRWYDHIDHALLADPEHQEALRVQEQVMSEMFEGQSKALHDHAVAEEHGIFKGLHTTLGGLADDRKLAILSYLNAPTEEGWDQIHSTCIKGFTTMWQAWMAVDPDCPSSKPLDGPWPYIPEPDILRAAMRQVSGVELVQDEDEQPENLVSLNRFR